MELLQEAGTAHKIQLLQEAGTEVLVLTSRKLVERWDPEIHEHLRNCARRGLRVRLLVDAGESQALALVALQAGGVELRQAKPRRFAWLFRSVPVQGEIWVFDRARALGGNVRLASRGSVKLECRFGADVARGAADYFAQRWENAAQPLTFSIRQQDFSFHSGQLAEKEFFGCLLAARTEITLSLPGARVSRRLEGALHTALSQGIGVVVFTNADGDNTPALRRLRRLATAGARVKVCGKRLGSECAVVDGVSIYMGRLPASWKLWKGTCPAFVVRSPSMGRELLESLEAQVSVEISLAR